MTEYFVSTYAELMALDQDKFTDGDIITVKGTIEIPSVGIILGGQFQLMRGTESKDSGSMQTYSKSESRRLHRAPTSKFPPQKGRGGKIKKWS